jgi:hypothetical protein
MITDQFIILYFRDFITSANLNQGVMDSYINFTVLERSLQEVRTKLLKSEKGVTNPTRKDANRKKFLLWIIKAFECLPPSIDKKSIDNWRVADGEEVNDLLYEFAACILSFLNQGATEVTSSLQDKKLSVRLLDIHGNNNVLCLCSRISVIYICILYRNCYIHKGAFLQQAAWKRL